jgi:anti-sigma B factor antagonist
MDTDEPAGGPPTMVEVRINGFLDAHTTVAFDAFMEDLLGRGYHKILINLEKLEYISSAGIGSMMVLLQNLRRRDGDMALVQPSQKVYKILDLLGFTMIFHVTQDRVAAMEILGSPRQRQAGSSRTGAESTLGSEGHKPMGSRPTVRSMGRIGPGCRFLGFQGDGRSGI